MLTYFEKRPTVFYNKKLYDYCKEITDNSIKKLTEKYRLERNTPKLADLLEDDDSSKPNFNFFNFIAFLSFSTLALYFYKRIK